MSASDLLEVAAIFGAIVAVWFALLGWKLVFTNRARGRSEPAGSDG